MSEKRNPRKNCQPKESPISYWFLEPDARTHSTFPDKWRGEAWRSKENTQSQTDPKLYFPNNCIISIRNAQIKERKRFHFVSVRCEQMLNYGWDYYWLKGCCPGFWTHIFSHSSDPIVCLLLKANQFLFCSVFLSFCLIFIVFQMRFILFLLLFLLLLSTTTTTAMKMMMLCISLFSFSEGNILCYFCFGLKCMQCNDTEWNKSAQTKLHTNTFNINKKKKTTDCEQQQKSRQNVWAVLFIIKYSPQI